MKTLAIRLEDEEHALLVLLARVDDVPLVEEIRQAIAGHVARKRSEPDFTARARAILAEIDQETAARRDAIQALFEPKGASEEAGPQTGSSRRGGGKAS